MDSLFGVEVTGATRFIIAFVVVLALIAVTAWLVRRFGSGALSSASARGRQPRLAVIDAASVDARRKLILVRRDNVEHLMMIGGPTDVVIEPNIVRAAAARDVSPGRAAPIPETMPRPVPLEEGAMWPPQPEPGPRAPRPAPPVPPAAAAAQWSAPGHQQPDVSARPHHPDTLAELADALPAQTPPRTEPVLESGPEPEVGSAPATAPERDAGPQLAVPTDEDNLAEMAQRLEAVLRRPSGGEPKRDGSAAEPSSNEPDVAASPADASEAAEPTTPERRPATSEPQPSGETRKFYETIEQEMASLLGRPTGKK